MKRTPLIFLFLLSVGISAQVPMNIKVEIAQAEDARRYDAVLENLMKSPNADVRARAALAAGRIGREEALRTLVGMLNGDDSVAARVMAAFAIGEIESINAADKVQETLRWHLGEPNVRLELLANISRTGKVPRVHARLVEAAGKIAAANASDPKAKELGKAIIDTLKAATDRDTILLGLTALLRARPEGADIAAAKFLTHMDARVRADAANTLARLRAKNANDTLRKMLARDIDPIARANAARALGAAEDKDAVEVLTNAALKDADSRVRVSAIRSLIPLRETKVVEHLINRGRELMKAYDGRRREIDGPEQVLPPEKSELLEIATALGRLLANSKHADGWKFLEELRYVDKHYSSEIEVALARVDPEKFMTVSNIGGVYLSRKTGRQTYEWRVANNLFAALNEYAAFPADGPLKDARAQAQKAVEDFLAAPLREYPKADPTTAYPAVANALGTLARFKPTNMNVVALKHLTHSDVAVRAAAAGALANLPASKENVDALKLAFTKSLANDFTENDAQFALMDTLYKLDKKESAPTVSLALKYPDYVLRKRAYNLLFKEFPFADLPDQVKRDVTSFAAFTPNHILPYEARSRTKLGQVLNTRADYVRALSRKNGSVKALLTTEKGTFTIDFYPEEAPLTVDNFIKLARSGYFNGVEVHRVVPNFVMQDGDPRGDGNGGPGWSIRCEVNMLMYERGMVGMALSGKDTGGSQWFVTHSPQPHLDGGYTIFGRVNEKDMKVVDNIVRGDKILNVRIIEAGSTQRSQRTQR